MPRNPQNVDNDQKQKQLFTLIEAAEQRRSKTSMAAAKEN